MNALQPAVSGPKPKKSVALSGVQAGNTALCTVGVTGNDLHYRGYDILEIANTCKFEEIASLAPENHPFDSTSEAYSSKPCGKISGWLVTTLSTLR